MNGPFLEKPTTNLKLEYVVVSFEMVERSLSDLYVPADFKSNNTEDKAI